MCTILLYTPLVRTPSSASNPNPAALHQTGNRRGSDPAPARTHTHPKPRPRSQDPKPARIPIIRRTVLAVSSYTLHSRQPPPDEITDHHPTAVVMRAATASLRLLPHLLFVLLSGVPNAVSKSTLESCASSTACPALLSYTLYADLKLSELAALFAADPLAILAANAIDFAVPDPADRILPAGLPLRVPVPCACSDGIRKATSVRYVARAGDTLASVAATVYGGLTTPDWIRDSNGMLDVEQDAALDAGTTLFVPLHCACFGGVDSGAPAVFLTYVVADGDTVPAIARRFRTTGNDLMSVNDMATPDVAAGDIIVVPLPGE